MALRLIGAALVVFSLVAAYGPSHADPDTSFIMAMLMFVLANQHDMMKGRD